ncbi:MAG: hypothetical protein ABH814_02135 [bacterium]
MRKKPWLDNWFNFVSLIALLVIAVFVVVLGVNFSALNLEVPEFRVPNYSAFYVSFSKEDNVSQTIVSEYGNLSRLRVGLNFVDDFSGEVLVQLAAGDDPSLVLFSKGYWFENEAAPRLLDIKFAPLEGKRFWLTLSSKARQGAVQVGYEPAKDIYPYGHAVFKGASDDDDLVFDSHTTISGGILQEAAQDFLASVRNDPVFFAFYGVLLIILCKFCLNFWP